MAELDPVPPGPTESATDLGTVAESTETWKTWLGQALLIVVAALTINLVGNGTRGLWDRDEPRYAGCAREMVARGDFFYPTFNDEPRFHKPILIYWLMLGGTAVFGDNPFGARVASALAGAGACLLVWGLGRRMFNPRAGLIAALALATAPLMVYNAKAATTDATLLLFLVACQFALWELGKGASRSWASVFWLGLSMATLTKGPIGPVLIAMSGLVAWWWGMPRTCWRNLRWRWGVPAFLLITAPWFIAIGILSHGDFFRVSMGYHVVKRMTTGIETHGGFPGYYVVGTMLTCYPWSALLPVGMLAAWSRRKGRPEMGFLLGWIVGPLVFLEIVQTKLIHYYLPAIPGCALLVAWLVEAVAGTEANLRRWPLGRLSLGLLTGLGIAMSVGLTAGRWCCPTACAGPAWRWRSSSARGRCIAMERFQAGATLRASSSLVATWAVAMLLAFGWLLPSVDPYRISPMVARRLADLSEREGARPAMATFKAPAVVYELGHPVPVLADKAELYDRLHREGPIVAALNDAELKWLKKDPTLSLDVRDTVQGLDVENPLRDDPLWMVIIRGAGGTKVRPAPIARHPGDGSRTSTLVE